MLGRTGKTSTTMFRGRSGTVCSFSSSRRFRRGWRRHSGRETSHGVDLEQDSWLRVGCEQSVPLTSRLNPPTPSRQGFPSTVCHILTISHISLSFLLPSACTHTHHKDFCFLFFPFSITLSLVLPPSDPSRFQTITSRFRTSDTCPVLKLPVMYPYD